MSVELPAGATVEQLLERLSLPEEVKTILVNGIVRDGAHAVADGDEVGLFPPVARG